MGWVGVGWQRRCRSLLELGNQGTVFLGGRSVTSGGRVAVDHVCEVENLYSVRGESSYHVPGSVYGKAPKTQLHSTPNAVHGSGHTGNKLIH